MVRLFQHIAIVPWKVLLRISGPKIIGSETKIIKAIKCHGVLLFKEI